MIRNCHSNSNRICEENVEGGGKYTCLGIILKEMVNGDKNFGGL